MKPLVSIIIPVFNGENYLQEAVDSALAQTYTNIEVLVINDGSTDKTEEIALSYGNKIRYFAKQNGGVSTALNLGIKHMQGEYFSWLSHDDLYEPEKITKQLSVIEKEPTKIVYSDYKVINATGEAIVVMDIKHNNPNDDLSYGLFPVMYQLINGCTLLIHKSHFTRIGRFNESLRTTQDYDLWFKMFRNQKLAHVNEPLIRSREHAKQTTHRYRGNNTESDELWLSMLQAITAEEVCKIGGTAYQFWKRQYAFLQRTQYDNAKKYARHKLDAIGGSKLSLKSIAGQFIYKMLSATSKMLQLLGLQAFVRKTILFKWGYKMWFYIRYKQ